MGATGKLESTGATMTVRFDRTVGAEPARVWAALTEPVLLGAWLTTAEFGATVGGKVHLVWPDDQGEMYGVVTQFDPFEALEYSWIEGETESLLRFELESTGTGSVLHLIHMETTPKDAVGFGAGWQAHLEALDDVLAGRSSAPADRDARYAELLAEYQAMATGD